MKRRHLLAAGSALAMAALPVRAAFGQTASKPFRVGFVTSAAPGRSPQYEAFKARFLELGYVEGRNLIIDAIFLDGHLDGYAQAMKMLVGRGADALLSSGPEAALKAALAASTTVPIVMSAFDYDPLALGYVKSLARPGGNITGVFTQQIDLAVKRAQLFKEARPDLAGAAMLRDGPSKDQWQATEAVSDSLRFKLLGVDVGALAYDYEKCIASIPADRRDGLFVPTSPIFFNDRSVLADLMLRQRLPAMFPFRESVAAGGLMSYGANFIATTRQLVGYFDKIARGATPAELPIEQPTKFELVINLKTANTLGLTIPPSILARADEVIE